MPCFPRKLFDKLTVKPKSPVRNKVSKRGKQRRCSPCGKYALPQWA